MPGSDTIFGAVCWGIQLLELHQGGVGPLLDSFKPPQFAFSSPGPVYRRKDKRLRFYPRPAWLQLEADAMEQLARGEIEKDRHLNFKRAVQSASDKAKQLKKLRHLSEGLFGEVVEGRLDGLEFCRRLLKPGDAGSNQSQIEVSSIVCFMLPVILSAYITTFPLRLRAALPAV
jgi:CRISPR/Cas system CSM-associated protein Csm4 (group 5 of RAMP superfamily)